ncbi:MAG: hypothetical protein H0W48_10735 [Methylibium sp.]|nr:hypothetical protein [Methylibium sp.]
MKLHILSDLHLSFGGLDRPQTEADAVVLAGDIARPRESVAWALGFDKPCSMFPATTSSTAAASRAPPMS